jgi:hypothetical protein
MREAWAAEPRHATHQGVPLDELLMSMGSGASTLDLSDEEPYYPGAPGSSPAASSSGSSMDGGAGGGGAAAARASAAAAAAARDMAGCGPASGVRAADGVGGSHILPIYPSAAAAFSPVCCHLPTLRRGREEGHEAVRRAVVPALERRRRA